jgi:copper(I)-binding protein
MKKFLLLLAAGLAIAVPALAHDYAVGALRIAHPWSRPSPVGAPAGAGYMTITNTGASDDRLTGGATPVAARLEIHEMSMTDGVMKMRPVSGGLVIPAGGTVILAPGGYHIMFIGLKAPLKVGDRVPVTLRFQNAGTIDLEFQVQVPPAGGKTH